MGIASFCVLMVSLLLVGVSVLFVMNVEILLGSIENKNEIVVFLNYDFPENKVNEAENTLKSLSNVSEVSYRPRDEALNRLIDQMDVNGSVYERVKGDNPLPNAFNVKVKDTSKITETVSQLNALSFTDDIKAPTEFAKVLNKLKKVVSIVSTALLVTLITVSLIMISNSTRASVYSRRREINIMKYVGATNAFIRIPFFFEGLFTGLVSGVGASAVTYYVYTMVMDIITNDVSLWKAIGVNEPLPFSEVKYFVIALYLCTGAIIGAIGSVTSTTKHLQV